MMGIPPSRANASDSFARVVRLLPLAERVYPENRQAATRAADEGSRMRTRTSDFNSAFARNGTLAGGHRALGGLGRFGVAPFAAHVIVSDDCRAGRDEQ